MTSSYFQHLYELSVAEKEIIRGTYAIIEAFSIPFSLLCVGRCLILIHMEKYSLILPMCFYVSVVPCLPCREGAVLQCQSARTGRRDVSDAK